MRCVDERVFDQLCAVVYIYYGPDSGECDRCGMFV